MENVAKTKPQFPSSSSLPTQFETWYPTNIQTITNQNFGILIAYLLPGFIGLWGLSFRIEQLQVWMGDSAVNSTTLGGFLYATLAAITLGLFVSTVRWLVIDTLHHKTGINRPNWDYGCLQKNLEAYSLLEESHYRYYQFYANTLLANIIGYLGWRTTIAKAITVLDIVFLVVLAVFYMGLSVCA